MGDTQTARLLLDGTTPAEPAVPARRRTKRRVLRNWLIVLGTLLVLLLIGAGTAYALLNDAYGDIQRVETIDPALERPEPAPLEGQASAPINILLLGSDSRETTDPDAVAEDVQGFRSDAILVAQISPDREHVTVMSIMRDNWVPIQGVGDAKINAGVSYGGIPLAVNTVEQFIDARIDHVALVDFESFKGLTDAVGGVTVHNDIAFTNQNGGEFSFEAGDITLDGEQALAFVRERYAFSDGDYQRARNQQVYLKGLLSKILSRDTLTSPGKVTETFTALKPHLIVDQELDLPAAIGLGLELRNLDKNNISFFTSPTLGTGTSPDGQSIVLPDWDQMVPLREAIRAGTLDEYAASVASAGS